MALAFLVACGGRKASSTESAEPAADLVPECVAYQDALKKCFHRDTGFASQPGLLAKTAADRARIGALCTESLRELETACR